MLAPATSLPSASPLDLLRLTLTTGPHNEQFLRRLTARALRLARALLARNQAAVQTNPESTSPAAAPTQPAELHVVLTQASIKHSPQHSSPDNTAAGGAPTQATPRASGPARAPVFHTAEKQARRAAILALRAHAAPKRVPEMDVVLNE